MSLLAGILVNQEHHLIAHLVNVLLKPRLGLTTVYQDIQ